MTLPENTINFPIIKQKPQTFATKFSKIEHLPAFDHGTTILTRLDQFQTTQNQFQQETALNFTQLKTRMQTLVIL
jgi:hypothetical protein